MGPRNLRDEAQPADGVRRDYGIRTAFHQFLAYVYDIGCSGDDSDAGVELAGSYGNLEGIDKAKVIKENVEAAGSHGENQGDKKKRLGNPLSYCYNHS